MADTSTVVRDPVCGMEIARESAVVVEHDATRYYFCEAACADTFRDAPERWIADEPQHHHSH